MRFILYRLLEAIPTIWVILTLTFILVNLAPGGPFDREKDLPPGVEEQINAYYGLDQPLPVQYVRYLGNLLRGDLGPSYQHPGWTVNEIIAAKLPVSLILGGASLLVALIIGLAAGIIASLRPGSWLDLSAISLATIGICLPSFVLGPLLLLAFGIGMEWFNVAGLNTPRDLVLPSITLGLFFAAYIARLTRSSLLEVHNLDYIRTARAKGAGERRILLIHSLRNAMVPVASYLGPAAAGLVSGSFVIETIFGIPGLGRYFVLAAINSDYTLVMGTVLVYALLLIAFNLVADCIIAFLNPRHRSGGTSR